MPPRLQNATEVLTFHHHIYLLYVFSVYFRLVPFRGIAIATMFACSVLLCDAQALLLALASQNHNFIVAPSLQKY